MTDETDFTPRPPCTIDWPRQFLCGPSDEHLHAIGQFISAYSLIEWDISTMFAFFAGLPAEKAQKLIVDTNMSTAGMIRYVTESIKGSDRFDDQACKDLLSVFQQFESMTKERHRIVHWQWAVGGNESASLSNLIKPRNPSEAHHSLPLQTLRGYSLKLMKIARALSLNMLIIRGQNNRDQILSVIEHTSPETPFRA